ncbi:hypothetical protein [Fusobacterium necrophorum]|uniref:Uncharacterized protein n=2 Tax=Fusobacterium necrophorum TaxID=859 RepID=A0AAN3VXB0_9FUSO|nr:hypothetical protein [Fusobacterium necrophorum]AYV94681.1 hypothetical protein BWX37_03195 [Fusobacterium necrophorum subsp. funduliforme]EJU18762.1 hypothetical protein HMPREF1127_1096 [Fusobacterium necrophorum subsp. funduliforme Fnf 1007]KYL03309.1 hypothetical protein A2J06_09235 [Fusobacterium necrophorum subsp. funduliforme]KYM40897.1 hypothetical protein A2U03_03710 [Fusobacterium necrophorum subsp. funduliforme]KYM52168.1 hypothetical protein A2U04_10135 [Fusobacterium necrophorum
MKLYHNCDVADLEKILKEGLQPLSVTKNDRWESNSRGNNSTDVVYLFKPISELNSFPLYGIVLLEVEVEATRNEMASNDKYYGIYEEFVVPEVRPEKIKKIMIPAIFAEKTKKYLSQETLKKVEFVAMTAKILEDTKIEAAEELLERFAKTCGISLEEERYFTGVKKNRQIISLCDVVYGDFVKIEEKKSQAINFAELQKEVLKNLEGEDVRKAFFFIKKGLENRGCEEISVSFEKETFSVYFYDNNYQYNILRVNSQTAEFIEK